MGVRGSACVNRTPPTRMIWGRERRDGGPCGREGPAPMALTVSTIITIIVIIIIHHHHYLNICTTSKAHLM